MSGVAVLREAQDRGFVVYRMGDRLRWCSSEPMPPDLLDRLSKHKTELLRLVPDRPATDLGGPWRVLVETCAPRQGPIQLDACTTIIDPVRCIETTLIHLELAVQHKNAGRESAFTFLIDEYVCRLAACGCQVRVESVA